MKNTLVYIIKRLILALFTIWVVITLTFFVMHAVPGGPFTSEKAVSPAVMKALEAKYGLDKPLMTQYLTYLSDVVCFRLGPSLKQRGRMVIDIIGDGLTVSARIGLSAAFIALILGIIAGSLAAIRRNTVFDRLIMILTTAFISMPSFISHVTLCGKSWSGSSSMISHSLSHSRPISSNNQQPTYDSS